MHSKECSMILTFSTQSKPVAFSGKLTWYTTEFGKVTKQSKRPSLLLLRGIVELYFLHVYISMCWSDKLKCTLLIWTTASPLLRGHAARTHSYCACSVVIEPWTDEIKQGFINYLSKLFANYKDRLSNYW